MARSNCRKGQSDVFAVVFVTCPMCNNSAGVTVHYTRRAVFGSCGACGTLGRGLHSGMIENRRWVDIPAW